MLANRLFENIGKGEFQVPKGDVDPVLESLIQGMLSTHFDDRFTILQIKDHDWLKKKHPVDAPPVTITPKDPNDPTMTTSVIPYLVDLHFGNEGLNQEMDEQGASESGVRQQNGNRDLKSNLITEHEIHEQERIKEVERQAGIQYGFRNTTSATNTDNGTRVERTESVRNKPTKCIKVKKMNNCLVS